MPHANDNGVKLWYDLNGSGEPLVVSGGFGLLHDQFAYIRDLLTPPPPGGRLALPGCRLVGPCVARRLSFLIDGSMTWR